MKRLANILRQRRLTTALGVDVVAPEMVRVPELPKSASRTFSSVRALTQAYTGDQEDGPAVGSFPIAWRCPLVHIDELSRREFRASSARDTSRWVDCAELAHGSRMNGLGYMGVIC